MRLPVLFSTLPLALAPVLPAFGEEKAAEKPELPPRPVAAAPT